MPFVTDGPFVRRELPNLAEAPSTLLEFAGSTFDAAFDDNPDQSIKRMQELESAQQGRNLSGVTRHGTIRQPEREFDSPMLSFEDAHTRVLENNLGDRIDVPREGIRELALDILIERHRTDLERELTAARYEGSGAIPTALAAGLAASVLDPLNIASAFVPVVGQTRYARMLAAAKTPAQRAKVRLKVGVAEGVVGAALVEPFPLLASAQDQTDYDMADSILNIAFGGILGGGLHTVGGALVDRLGVSSPRIPLQHNVVDRPQLVAKQRGWTIEDHIAKAPDTAAELDGLGKRLTRDIEGAKWTPRPAKAVGEFTGDAESTVDAVQGTLAVDSPQAFDDALEVLSESLDVEARDWSFTGDNFGAVVRVQTTTGQVGEIQIVPRQLVKAEAKIAKLTDSDEIAKVRQDAFDSLGEAWQPLLNRRDAAPVSDNVVDFEPAQETVAKAPHRVQNAALRTAVAQAASGRPVDVEPVFKGDVQGAARQPDRTPTEASQAADAEVSAEGDATAELEASIAEIEARLPEGVELPPNVVELVSEAEAYSKGVLEAAVCMRAQ